MRADFELFSFVAPAGVAVVSLLQVGEVTTTRPFDSSYESGGILYFEAY
jgi:hypothetical protein